MAGSNASVFLLAAYAAFLGLSFFLGAKKSSFGEKWTHYGPLLILFFHALVGLGIWRSYGWNWSAFWLMPVLFYLLAGFSVWVAALALSRQSTDLHNQSFLRFGASFVFLIIGAGLAEVPVFWFPEVLFFEGKDFLLLSSWMFGMSFLGGVLVLLPFCLKRAAFEDRLIRMASWAGFFFVLSGMSWMWVQWLEKGRSWSWSPVEISFLLSGVFLFSFIFLASQRGDSQRGGLKSWIYLLPALSLGASVTFIYLS
jgi:hypothetical protein